MLAIIDAPILIGILMATLLFGVLPVWFLWRAFDRAGLPGAIALIGFLPGGIVLGIGILAFADWPKLRA